MVAVDLDEGPNGQVTYRMQVGMPRMDFVINSTSGLVTSTAVLDRERIAEYYLRVVASDAGAPSKSSTSTLTVKGGCIETLSKPFPATEPPQVPKRWVTRTHWEGDVVYIGDTLRPFSVGLCLISIDWLHTSLGLRDKHHLEIK